MGSKNTGLPAFNRIGIIIPCDQETFLASFFYGTLFSGIEFQAEKAGKKLVLSSVAHDQVDGPRYRAFEKIQHEVDGFIVVNLLPAVYLELQDKLRAMSWPLVVLYYQSAAEDIDTIISDNYKNARAMTEFLIRLGHTRIAFGYHAVSIASQGESLKSDYVRGQAYRDAMQEHGLAPVLFNAANSETLLVGQLRQLLQPPHTPTAFFCHDDALAMRFYTLLPSLKIKIPDDLTVVGYDGIPDGQKAVPPLTTLQTPLWEMGAASVTRLLEKIREKSEGRTTHQRITLPGIIVERGSHRRLP